MPPNPSRLTLAIALLIRRRKAHRPGHEVGNGHYQVGDVVGLGIHLRVAHLFAGDLQHLVLDHVAQVKRLENQVQGALEHDVAAEVDADRRIGGDSLFRQTLLVDVQVDPGEGGQLVQHFAQRSIGELQ